MNVTIFFCTLLIGFSQTLPLQTDGSGDVDGEWIDIFQPSVAILRCIK